ncbi:MAG: ATP-dependent DNA helicase [Nitrososphaeraceae archaeon]
MLDISDFLRNFPFDSLRANQKEVIEEVCDSLNSGYKYILLEAPTGFGKSAVGVTIAQTLGSSYICTATKDLQTQYSQDFGFLKSAKGKNNFPCLVKEDFIRSNNHKCGVCIGTKNECVHISCDYGPCMHDESMEGSGCKYRTFVNDYFVLNSGTRKELISLMKDKKENYEKQYLDWLHLKNLNGNIITWKPCEYYDQLNKALVANHSIFNYSNFLALLPNKNFLPSRSLLILDEAHLLETEIVKFRGLSITRKRWKRYINDFILTDYGYNLYDWLEFLIKLEKKILCLIGQESLAESLAVERKAKYHFLIDSKKNEKNRTRIISASALFEDDETISSRVSAYGAKNNIGEELLIEIIQDVERLTRVINNILSNPKNWIVSEVHKENYEVTRVDLKPLDPSAFCKPVLEKCSKSLIMSATILNEETFCKNIGLSVKHDRVKFIKVESDFPVDHRPLIPLNVEYLSFDNLGLVEVQKKISRAIDNIMHIHKKDKGIIHTTSYVQLNFIMNNLSQENARRLLVTDPEIERDEVIRQHSQSTRPSVLISPSLHTGLDLRDDLSRFQVITKVPYPNITDKWIYAKRKGDAEWYYWQTALKLIQAYGRSVRSKDDWAKTYVLDSAFNYYVRKNERILPKWFINAIKRY